MKFSDRLKELRLIRGLRQEDLAALMHVHRSTIAGYESRDKQPDFEKLIWLADFFEVSTDYLLGRSGAPPPAIRADDLSAESRKKLLEYRELLKMAERK